MQAITGQRMQFGKQHLWTIRAAWFIGLFNALVRAGLGARFSGGSPGCCRKRRVTSRPKITLVSVQEYMSVIELSVNYYRENELWHGTRMQTGEYTFFG